MKLRERLLQLTLVGLPPPATDKDDANANPLTDTQSNSGATRMTGRWTLEEVVKLTSAVANTSKKKWSNEYKIYWGKIATLVSSRTIAQCRDRWYKVLNRGINPATGCEGRWTAVEDSKLKDAVPTHGGDNWEKIAALFSGRTRLQCKKRRKAAKRTLTWDLAAGEPNLSD
jgi:hypothetical protein